MGTPDPLDTLTAAVAAAVVAARGGPIPKGELEGGVFPRAAWPSFLRALAAELGPDWNAPPMDPPASDTIYPAFHISSGNGYHVGIFLTESDAAPVYRVAKIGPLSS